VSEKNRDAGAIVVEMIQGMVERGDEALAPHPGMEHLRRLWPSVKAAFPDFRAELQQQVVDGDRVATHWIFSGTHRAPYSEWRRPESPCASRTSASPG
jgi:predicted ester cyclase